MNLITLSRRGSDLHAARAAAHGRRAPNALRPHILDAARYSRVGRRISIQEQLGRTDVAVVGELLLVGWWIGLSMRIAGDALGAPWEAGGAGAPGACAAAPSAPPPLRTGSI